MKTAFKIPPDLSEQPLKLLIEVGVEGIAFVYYHGSPVHVEGLFIYHYDQPGLLASFAEDLKHFLQNESLPSFHGCNICFNFKESSVVPNRYFDEAQKSDVLEVLFGENPTTESFAQEIKGMQAKLLYRIPLNIIAALKNTFPNASYHHSTALQLSFLDTQTPMLYAIVYQQHVKIFLFTNNQVQLQQYFDYNTPTDVAYLLLHVCEQHQVAPNSILLQLSGFIDQQSNLYEELYKYFLNIRFDGAQEETVVTENIKEYPAHFFIHYFQLIPCVS